MKADENPGKTGTSQVKQNEVKLFLNLAVPSIIENIGQQSIWIISSSFAGRNLGASALGGLSLAKLGILGGKTIIFGLTSAYDTLAGAAYGVQNYEEIGFLAQRTLILCAAISVFVGFFFLNIEPFFQFINQPGDVVVLAVQFLKGYGLVFPVEVCIEILKGFFRCQNICLPFTINTWICAILHLVMVPVLSDTFGFIGVFYAHLINQVLVLFLDLVYAVFAKSHHANSWPGINLSKALELEKVKSFLSLGIPGIFSFSEYWFWEAQTVLAGSLGGAALAAHSIAYNVIPVMFYIPFGFATAAQTRIATLLAQNKNRLAKKVAVNTLLITCFTTLCSSAGSYFFRYNIFLAFTSASSENYSEIMRQFEHIWIVISTFLITDGLLGASMGIFRGASLHGRLGSIMFIWLWLIGFPFEVALLFYFKFGLFGLWFGLLLIYIGMDASYIIVILFRDWGETLYEPVNTQDENIT